MFDRDDHKDFHNALSHNALNKAQSLHQRIRKDDGKLVTFRAIPSIPCFEFWLLLHYEDVTALFPRNEVMKKLKTHYRDYEKNAQDVWNHTKDNFDVASKRAAKLMAAPSPHSDDLPYTAIGDLVEILMKLKKLK